MTTTALSKACTSNSISEVIKILSETPALINEPLSWNDSDGKELTTPAIFIAIDYGHVDLVNEMLQFFKSGTSIDKLKSGSGDYNALGWASWVGNLKIVKLLVEEADATVDDEALELSRESGNPEVTKYLLENIDLYSNLDGDADAIMSKACREGDIKMVQRMLNFGYSPEQCAEGPLFIAMKCGHMDIVTLFREVGVEMNLELGGHNNAEKFKAMAEEFQTEGENEADS
jgi:ankyrin repeat protein